MAEFLIALPERVSGFIKNIAKTGLLYKISAWLGNLFFPKHTIIESSENTASITIHSLSMKPLFAVAKLKGKFPFARNSSIIKCFSSFYRILTERSIKSEKDTAIVFVIFALLGALGTVIYFALGAVYAAIAVDGLFGFGLVMYMPVAGVFAAAFLIPIVPTKVILALSILTIVSYGIHFLHDSADFTPDLMDLFSLLFAVLLAFSCFISFRPSGSFPMAAVYILFIIFAIVSKNLLNTKKKFFAVLSLLISSSLFVSLYGIYQRFTGNLENREMWLDADMFTNVGARVYSTLENPNVLGEYLIISISISAAALYFLKKPVSKIAALIVAVIGGVCMILTLSRGAWLGLMIAALVFAVLAERKLIWLFLLAAIISPLVMPDSILDRFLSIGNVADSSTSYRVNIWRASLEILKVFWPIGIGQGEESFVTIYSLFSLNAITAPHSHNLYLQIIIDLGICGFLLFVCCMLIYFKNLLSLVKKADKQLKFAAAGLAAGMVGYLAQGATDNVWYNYRVVCLFWFLLAASCAAYRLGRGVNIES
ncbi:MAG: O-antigen ligase family protein [Clostridiales bacterium]|nr:O-antigen ligase family protein [Clostridiales bacterium]